MEITTTPAPTGPTYKFRIVGTDHETRPFNGAYTTWINVDIDAETNADPLGGPVRFRGKTTRTNGYWKCEAAHVRGTLTSTYGYGATRKAAIASAARSAAFIASEAAYGLPAEPAE